MAIRFTDFCERTLRVKLTPGQRVLALVGVDGVDPERLEGAERELADKLFGGVARVPAAARSIFVIVKGARCGGTYIFAAIYSLFRALTANLSTMAPGEQATALIVAPDMRLGRQALRFALGAAKSTPEIARLIESESTDGFTLKRRDGALVAIEVLPATRGGSAVRGRSLVSAVLSEASFFRDESSVVNDNAIAKAVLPRVLPGGLLVLESTPWAEAGLLHDEFQKNFGHPTVALAARATTWLVARPQERALAEREALRDPENSAREFGGEFIAGGSALFFAGALDGAVVEHLQICENAPVGASVSIGGDLGLVRDSSAFVAVHTQAFELTVADVLELKPKKGSPLKLSEVVKAGCEFAAKHGARFIHVDHHVLEPAREHLPAGFALLPVDGGAEAKAARYIRTRDALRARHVRIPQALAGLVTQLSAVASKPMPGGGLQITLPRRVGSGHLDAVSALVIALAEAAEVAARGLPRQSFARTALIPFSGTLNHRTGFMDGAAPEQDPFAVPRVLSGGGSGRRFGGGFQW